MHSQPNNPELYSQHYRDEQILLTLLKNDPLAKKDHLSFKDLTGRSILGHEGANFWLDIFKKNIPKLNLLVQTNMPSLDKIVHDSPLPVFNSSLEIKKHDIPENKSTIPIVDKDSFASYYVICKQKDFKKFKALFEFFTSDVPGLNMNVLNHALLIIGSFVRRKIGKLLIPSYKLKQLIGLVVFLLELFIVKILLL